MATVTPISAPRIQESLDITNRPLLTKLCLALTDCAALVASVGLSIAVKTTIEGNVHLASYLQLWPFLFVFLLVYAVAGLYSIVALSPAGELRRGTLCSAVSFLLLSAVTVSLRGAHHQFTWTLFLALGFSVALMPVMRAGTRRLFSAKNWWGYPAVIFGAGETAEKIMEAMLNDCSMSLKPVAFIDENSSRRYLNGLPVFTNYENARLLIPEGNQAYAVFAAPDLPAHERDEIVDRCRPGFSHILVVPELNGLSSLWMNSKNVGGMLGLEIIQHKLHGRIMRSFDIALALLPTRPAEL